MGSTKSKQKLMNTIPQFEDLEPENIVNSTLQNELVLEKIASFLSFDELKCFRLVNKVWHRTSSTAFRKLSFMNFADIRKLLRPCLQTGREWSESTAEKFLYGLKLKKCARKHKGTLTKLVINNQAGFSCSAFYVGTELNYIGQHFFNDVLHKISNYVTEFGLEITESVLQLQTTGLVFPNLRKFKMVECIDNKEYSGLELQCFQHIMRHSPNLNDLTLFLIDDDKRAEVYLNTMDVSQCQKIKNLHLRVEMRTEHFTMLQEKGFTLEQLHLTFGNYSRFSKESLTAFLETQNTNVKVCVDIVCLKYGVFKYDL